MLMEPERAALLSYFKAFLGAIKYSRLNNKFESQSFKKYMHQEFGYNCVWMGIYQNWREVAVST